MIECGVLACERLCRGWLVACSLASASVGDGWWRARLRAPLSGMGLCYGLTQPQGRPASGHATLTD